MNGGFIWLSFFGPARRRSSFVPLPQCSLWVCKSGQLREGLNEKEDRRHEEAIIVQQAHRGLEVQIHTLPKGELTQSLPFGAPQGTDHHTQEHEAGALLPGDSSKCKSLRKQRISKLLLFINNINTITANMSFWVQCGNLCTLSIPILLPRRSCQDQDLLLTNVLKDAMSIHLLMKDKHLTPQPSFHIPQLSNVRCRTACKILCPKAEKSSKAIIASLGKGQLLDCLEMPIHTCCTCVGSRLWSSCGILEKLWQIKN